MENSNSITFMPILTNVSYNSQKSILLSVYSYHVVRSRSMWFYVHNESLVLCRIALVICSTYNILRRIIKVGFITEPLVSNHLFEYTLWFVVTPESLERTVSEPSARAILMQPASAALPL